MGWPGALLGTSDGYVPTVVALSLETFDAIEFDAACSGEHRAAAQEMTRLADTGTQTAAMPRSEAYIRAGEQPLLARPDIGLRPGHRRGLRAGVRKPGHLFRRSPVLTAARGFELDRVERLGAQDNHVRDVPI